MANIETKTKLQSTAYDILVSIVLIYIFISLMLIMDMPTIFLKFIISSSAILACVGLAINIKYKRFRAMKLICILILSVFIQVRCYREHDIEIMRIENELRLKFISDHKNMTVSYSKNVVINYCKTEKVKIISKLKIEGFIDTIVDPNFSTEPHEAINAICKKTASNYIDYNACLQSTRATNIYADSLRTRRFKISDTTYTISVNVPQLKIKAIRSQHIEAYPNEHGLEKTNSRCDGLDTTVTIYPSEFNWILREDGKWLD